MIVRSPYAFFIKLFKPIHLVMAFLTVYLIYLESKITDFLNIYIYSSSNTIPDNVSSFLVSELVYIIPFIIIIFSLIILGIMFKKKKPVTFYLFCIFSFLVVTVINFYAANILKTLETTILAIRAVKLIYDLVRINVIIETIAFIFLIVRGIGLNFKKFSFDSDLSKIEINESDKQEFELDINVDLAESKRKRRRSLRYLKYAYLENKFLINCVSIILVCLLSIGIYSLSVNRKLNKEGTFYYNDGISINVQSTSILTTNFRGKKITDNYLIVLNIKIKANSTDIPMFLKDLSLNIGEAIFKPTTKYNNNLLDLGIGYEGQDLSTDYSDYLIVYEIPEKYINSDMVFIYKGLNNSLKIKLNPKRNNAEDKTITHSITQNVSFKESIGDINFTINNFDIKDKFVINYNYCIKKGDCVPSIEYLKPSIDQNFDKAIIKLDINYKNNTDLKYKNFYSLFETFGSVYYLIDGKWYYQSSNFEEIKSSKTNFENTVYIGVKNDIFNASSIKLVFNVRNIKYEYILK